MVGMTCFVAGGGDGDASGWGKETFGFAEIIAQCVVNWLMDGAVFVGLKELGGELFGNADGRRAHLTPALSPARRGRRTKGHGGGEIHALDTIGKFVLSVFEKAEADAGGVDLDHANGVNGEKGFEALLLFRQAHFIQAKDGANDVKIAEAFDDGNDGAIAVASDIDAGKEMALAKTSVVGAVIIKDSSRPISNPDLISRSRRSPEPLQTFMRRQRYMAVSSVASSIHC